MEVSKLPFRCIYCLMYQEKFEIEMECEECKYYKENHEVSKEIEKYVYKERRYDLRTCNGAGNRSDIGDQGQRT